MTERKKRLTELLHKQYGCEQPFIDPPEYIGKNVEGVDMYAYFTQEGKQAYFEMLKFLFELEFLDIIDDSIDALRKINKIIVDKKEDN